MLLPIYRRINHVPQPSNRWCSLDYSHPFILHDEHPRLIVWAYQDLVINSYAFIYLYYLTMPNNYKTNRNQANKGALLANLNIWNPFNELNINA